jgi:hypothetical protein
LYGVDVVISSNVCTLWNRRPADVGLYFRIGMTAIPRFEAGGARLAVAPARA